MNSEFWGGNGSPVFCAFRLPPFWSLHQNLFNFSYFLVFLGGEGPLRDNSVTGHFITYAAPNKQTKQTKPKPKTDICLHSYQLAQQYRALVIACEHRFYGESQPFGNLRTANLKYLTSQQALADAAALATALKGSVWRIELQVYRDGWLVFWSVGCLG